jgi:hypothetical protein
MYDSRQLRRYFASNAQPLAGPEHDFEGCLSAARVSGRTRLHQCELHGRLLFQSLSPNVERLFCQPSVFAKSLYGATTALLLGNQFTPILGSRRSLFFLGAFSHATTMALLQMA